MNHNFDLNIMNYSVEDLADMFALPSTFDANVIEVNENLLRNQISKSRELSPVSKKNTLDFVSKAKSILLNFLERNNKKQNATELTKLTYNIHERQRSQCPKVRSSRKSSVILHLSIFLFQESTHFEQFVYT